MVISLTHEFASELPELAIQTVGQYAPAPRGWIINSGLATELGIDPKLLETEAAERLLVGAEASGAVAQRYSGHQFGAFSPVLGDGRAMLLGELHTPDGLTRDLHLKGSGPTQVSRGDGFATLEATLREFLMSEAMHALGVPTTRALAVLTTGRPGRRNAVLARTAASHIRVGSFQYARMLSDDHATLQRLLALSMRRHDPDLIEGFDRDPGAAAREFFSRVVSRQAHLVAKWMLVGFVHGVMNTDNVLVSGETIDYGPCAFMNGTDFGAVFSSIDRAGRYAYGAQPAIMQWNLARLADALLPLFATEQDHAVRIAEETLATYGPLYQAAWEAGMREKLGLDPAHDVRALAEDLLSIMHEHRLDYTGTFRTLTELAAGERSSKAPQPLTAWAARWIAEGPDPTPMRAANPITIARNHHLQEALDRASAGDPAPFTRLLEAVTHPYESRPEWQQFSEDLGGSAPFVTYCGT